MKQRLFRHTYGMIRGILKPLSVESPFDLDDIQKFGMTILRSKENREGFDFATVNMSKLKDEEMVEFVHRMKNACMPTFSGNISYEINGLDTFKAEAYLDQMNLFSMKKDDEGQLKINDPNNRIQVTPYEEKQIELYQKLKSEMENKTILKGFWFVKHHVGSC
jgi:hypothetical protein